MIFESSYHLRIYDKPSGIHIFIQTKLPIMKSLLSFACFILTIFHLSGQETRLVPQDYATIQAALNVSGDDDVILVSPGIYEEHILFQPHKEGVELRSTDGPEQTIIDGANSFRPLTFDGELEISRNTIVDGFTIRNGFLNAESSRGGGVYMDEASPTLRN